MTYFKSTITIYTDQDPTRDIEALARDAVCGDSICTGHEVVEVSKEEIASECGDFFFEPEEEDDGQ